MILLIYFFLCFIFFLLIIYFICAYIFNLFPFKSTIQLPLKENNINYQNYFLSPIKVITIQNGNQPAVNIRNNLFRIFYKYDYELILNGKTQNFFKEGDYRWFKDNEINVTLNDLIINLNSIYYEYISNVKNIDTIHLKVYRTIATSNLSRADQSHIFSSLNPFLDTNEIITHIHFKDQIYDNDKIHSEKLILGEETIFLTDTINIV